LNSLTGEQSKEEDRIQSENQTIEKEREKNIQQKVIYESRSALKTEIAINDLSRRLEL
jgi:hypothetical protein